MNTAKLETLKNKHQQMAARIRAMEAKSMIQQRKEDTRRKILIGAYILNKYQTEQRLDGLIAELDPFLTRTRDRALFNLLPLENPDAP